jgi:hypothetical protein
MRKTANAILKATHDSYSRMESYADTGTLDLWCEPPRRRRLRLHFRTRFRRPRSLQFACEEKAAPSGGKPFRITVEYEGAEGILRDSIHVDRKRKSLDELLGIIQGVSFGTSTTIPRLLLPKVLSRRSDLQIQDPQRLSDVRVNGQLCYQLRGVAPHPQEQGLIHAAISKRKHHVLRLRTQVKLGNVTGTLVASYRPAQAAD